MKRAFFFVVVFFLGIAFAQSDGAKPSGYEYSVFLVDARDFKEKDDWKEMVDKVGDEFHADPAFKAKILNHLAKEGWDLVQVVPAVKDKAEIVHLYLRRAKR